MHFIVEARKIPNWFNLTVVGKLKARRQCAKTNLLLKRFINGWRRNMLLAEMDRYPMRRCSP